MSPSPSLSDDDWLGAALDRLGATTVPAVAASAPWPEAPPPPASTTHQLARPFIVEQADAFEQTLERLLTWVTELVGASHSFVANAEGLLLAGEQADEIMVATTGSLVAALRSLPRWPRSVVIDTDGHYQYWLWLRTDMGLFVLGVSTPRPIEYFHHDALYAALGRVFATLTGGA